jgi:signal transduction histidine kinase
MTISPVERVSLGGVQRVVSLLRSRGLDALVVALAVADVVRIWIEGISPRGATTVLALLATLPLLARRRLPLVAPIGALLALLGLSLLAPGAAWEQLQLFLGALLCFWVIGSENDRRHAIAGLAAGLAIAAGTVATDSGHRGFGDYAFGLAITAAAWAAGVVLGTHSRAAAVAERRAERLALEQEMRAEQAAAEERARIARELHDVIAHTVSVMVVQAGAAEQVLEGENPAAREALAAIRESGKGALVELRRLLGFLREGEGGATEPRPTLERLDELAARVRSGGIAVEVEQTGAQRPLAPGLDQAAYRIVQEALTNTVKHAHASRAVVAIAWEPSAVVLSVTDDGVGVDGDARGGHGLIGMRERAALYDGELETGPLPGGGFRVEARLPL